ncbi:MAG TPA: hypothetical protein VIV20_10210 [Gammaproteobacteria bacterium]
MFTLGISGLIAAYILIAAILLSINLYSNWSWKVKASTIIITSFFYVITYISYPKLLGWPTADNPPQRFRLIAAQVEQPDKITGDEGAVYLWLTQIDALSSSNPPRAYKLEYSNELHEKIINVNSKLNKDIPQLGEFDDHDNIIDELKDAPRSGQKTVKIEFYDLPDPMFPDK